MVTLFRFTNHNKDKILILPHRKINVFLLWLVSLKCISRLQSYGKSPITSGSPLVLLILCHLHKKLNITNQCFLVSTDAGLCCLKWLGNPRTRGKPPTLNWRPLPCHWHKSRFKTGVIVVHHHLIKSFCQNIVKGYAKNVD